MHTEVALTYVSISLCLKDSIVSEPGRGDNNFSKVSEKST